LFRCNSNKRLSSYHTTLKQNWSHHFLPLTPYHVILFPCPYTQKQSHVQVWIRLLDLPQEYWLPETSMEIACGVGTPLLIDEATKKRAFGHYARILVDVDLSKHIFEEVMVEREGYAFFVPIVYERLPELFSNCYTIGHFVAL